MSYVQCLCVAHIPYWMRGYWGDTWEQDWARPFEHVQGQMKTYPWPCAWSHVHP